LEIGEEEELESGEDESRFSVGGNVKVRPIE
jgi:hypothetical protein